MGGAIAQAALGGVNEKKVFGVITTHYANLEELRRELSRHHQRQHGV